MCVCVCLADLWRESFGATSAFSGGALSNHTLPSSAASGVSSERPQSQPNFHSAAGGDQPGLSHSSHMRAGDFFNLDVPGLVGHPQSPASGFPPTPSSFMWSPQSGKEDDAKSDPEKRVSHHQTSFPASPRADSFILHSVIICYSRGTRGRIRRAHSSASPPS